MSDQPRFELGSYTLPQGIAFRLSAEVREAPERGTLVLSIHATPADAPADAKFEDSERARYSIWLARIGDRPWVAVDHAQGMSSIATQDGQPYLYWHGKTPGSRDFT